MAFETFQVAELDTSGARIHFRHGGKGKPLLLLHGNPLTHYSWHKIADRLAQSFHVVAADLRGYGDSSAPEPGENHINYSFRAMAQDQVEVMASLGFDTFCVAGIDRGARVAHRMCLDHPEKVAKVTIIDIVPSHVVWKTMNMEMGLRSWHWLFMAQPSGLPEKMMGAVSPDWYIAQKCDSSVGDHVVDEGVFTKEAIAEYVRCFNEKTIRGSCGDYRAAATCDHEMDLADIDRKVTAPLEVLWGKHSHAGRFYGDVLDIWRQHATDLRGGGAFDCGHYVNEEAPDQTYRALMRHFGD